MAKADSLWSWLQEDIDLFLWGYGRVANFNWFKRHVMKISNVHLKKEPNKIATCLRLL